MSHTTKWKKLCSRMSHFGVMRTRMVGDEFVYTLYAPYTVVGIIICDNNAGVFHVISNAKENIFLLKNSRSPGDIILSACTINNGSKIILKNCGSVFSRRVCTGFEVTILYACACRIQNSTAVTTSFQCPVNSIRVALVGAPVEVG